MVDNLAAKFVSWLIGLVLCVSLVMISVGLWFQAQKTTITGVDPTAKLSTGTKFAAFMEPFSLPGGLLLAVFSYGILVIIAIVGPNFRTSGRGGAHLTA